MASWTNGRRRLASKGQRGDPVTYPLHMRDLYQRLRNIGFDADFVRTRILPDWWDDSLASTPANRALAEAAISKMLGFAIADLRNAEARLRLPPADHVRLKRRMDTHDKDVAPAILVAERAAIAIAGSLQGVPRFEGGLSAASLRKAILETRRVVDLESLLHFAWEHGVAVIHVSQLPSASKRFSGMALFCKGLPVVVLASGRDSPPWIAFHLAHELGHILLHHVRAGQGALADVDIDRRGTDEQERESDAFACEVLTGDPHPSAVPILGLTGERLAAIARHEGAQKKIDPGAIALVYGRKAERMGVAQKALNLLGMDRGAHSTIAKALGAHLPGESSDLTARFLALVHAA